jgi:hypothetical protein
MGLTSSPSGSSFGTLSGSPTDNTALAAALAGKAASSHTHALSDLSQSGATSGQVPTWNGSAWAAATPSGGGGSSLSTPKVAYVETTGNDGTAVIGDPSKPFATAQAAHDAIVIADGPAFSIHLGVGTFGGLSGYLSTKLKSITGRGATVSFLGGIVNSGQNPGEPGGAIVFESDMSCNFGDIISRGEAGDYGSTDGEYGNNGGDGGVGGLVELKNVLFEDGDVGGGNGGEGGVGAEANGTGGAGGHAGSFKLLNCRFNVINAEPGTPGGGPGEPGLPGGAGDTWLVQCVFRQANIDTAQGESNGSVAVQCVFTDQLSQAFGNTAGTVGLNDLPIGLP